MVRFDSGLVGGYRVWLLVGVLVALTASATAVRTTSTTILDTRLVIDDVVVSGVTNVSAVISWVTDEASDSVVEYEGGDGCGLVQSSPDLVTVHEITLGELTPGDLIHFRARSTNGSGNTAMSSDYSFSTPLTFYETEVEATVSETVTVNATGYGIPVVLELKTVGDAVGDIRMSVYSEYEFSAAFSLLGTGRYIRIEAGDALSDALDYVVIMLCYTDEGVEGLNEDSLNVYHYNPDLGGWELLRDRMDWVYDTGVDSVGNYVWANVSHFSDYTLGGDVIVHESSTTLPRRRRRSRGPGGGPYVRGIKVKDVPTTTTTTGIDASTVTSTTSTIRISSSTTVATSTSTTPSTILVTATSLPREAATSSAVPSTPAPGVLGRVAAFVAGNVPAITGVVILLVLIIYSVHRRRIT
ncbi:MAG: fibronectin type III domain-containing protein [Candidatus Altiarchaeota archaeon]|nr:fibronectin type III domain-containing protein [Candidatus Altiarchaeota archaeon]